MRIHSFMDQLGVVKNSAKKKTHYSRIWYRIYSQKGFGFGFMRQKIYKKKSQNIMMIGDLSE